MCKFLSSRIYEAPIFKNIQKIRLKLYGIIHLQITGIFFSIILSVTMLPQNSLRYSGLVLEHLKVIEYLLQNYAD